MDRKILFLIPMALFLLCATPAMAEDVGVQFGSKWSSIGGYPTTIGLKIVEHPFSFTARGGLYYFDKDTPGNNEDVTWLTLGGTVDYYLRSEDKLKPYVGGDLDLHFYEIDDNETSISLNPHFGVEYWIEERFSVSGEAGLGFGFGEVYDIEERIGTTTSIHATYYF